ncbi:hypothetical protein L1987_28347 [Smallanthus sonchifolius]|uniref:Uncharacterized protein n=1 Tax=Smallanthus sonchifolius TaxID=185202 RepID=A0ACB9HYE6_9ASTR|nr:hypothetical protein L1987_28347 [Smallanthus sonchifolius]
MESTLLRPPSPPHPFSDHRLLPTPSSTTDNHRLSSPATVSSPPPSSLSNTHNPIIDRRSKNDGSRDDYLTANHKIDRRSENDGRDNRCARTTVLRLEKTSRSDKTEVIKGGAHSIPKIQQQT